MVRYNFFTVLFLLIFCCLITSCSKKEANLYNANNYKDLAKNNSISNTQKNSSYNIKEYASQEDSVKRRGLFSLLFQGSKKECNKLDNNTKQIAKQDSLNKNNTTIAQSKKVKKEKITNNKTVDKDSTGRKDNSVVKSFVSFFNFFSNNNLQRNKNTRYPVDLLSVEDNLNIAVLKIPENNSEKNEIVFYCEDNKLLKSMPTTLPTNISLDIINDQIYYDIFGINNLTSNNFYNDQSSKQNSNKELSPSDIYKNYFIALKYGGLLTNYNEVLPNKYLSLLHRALISQLLLKKGNSPQVLYIFYRRINEDVYISSKEHLYLTSYLNNIRSYIYSKKVPNLYLQEVQVTGLPVDEVLLVLKPITAEQYSCLPKQVNIFNAKKMSIKTWLEKSKILESNK